MLGRRGSRRLRGAAACALLAAWAATLEWPVPAHAAPRAATLRYAVPRGDHAQAKLLLMRRGARVLLENERDGELLAAASYARTGAISIHGSDGAVDNTLTIDLGGGSIALPGGIRYDGGRGGYNTLVLRGGRAGAERSVSYGPHSGLLRLGHTRVSYSDIAPILDTTPAVSYTFNDFSAGALQIANGEPVGEARTIAISGTGFETTTIANKQKVTVSGLGGSNSFSVDVTAAPSGLTGPLTLDTSTDSASSALFKAIPAGVAVAYTGGPEGSTTVAGTAGAQSVGGVLSLGFVGSPGSIALEDGGDPIGRTVEVGASHVSGLTPNAIAYSGASRLTVEGGSGSDTFEATPSPSTVYTILGGGPAPPAFPGDQLIADLAGSEGPSLIGARTPAGAQGAWLFANRLPVTFAGIDSLTPTAATISDATVNPGTGGATARFDVQLLAPTTAGVQIPYATADGSASAAAGNYRATSGMLTLVPGQGEASIGVEVPGTSAPGPTREFQLTLSPTAQVQLLRGRGTGSILNTNTNTAPPAAGPPVLSALRQSVARWREGSGLARLSATPRPAVGTVFSFGLDQAATVTLSFSRSTAGTRVHGRCTSAVHRARRPECRLFVPAGSLALAAHAGTDRVSFYGRLSASKRLPTGSYRMTAAAVNAGGRRSAATTLGFTIVK